MNTEFIGKLQKELDIKIDTYMSKETGLEDISLLLNVLISYKTISMMDTGTDLISNLGASNLEGIEELMKKLK